MAMPPERSRPLHNFTLPRLKWGNQRFLRCMNSNKAPATGHSSSSPANRRSPAPDPQSNALNHRRRPGNELIKRRSPNATETSRKSPLNPVGARSSVSDQDGIDAVREKLMLDLRVAADRMKVSILEEKEKELDDSNSARPWNLRTRTAACKAPAGGGGKQVNCNSSSPLRVESPMATAKSSRLRGLAAAAAAATSSSSRQSVEKEERPKFSISLTREEIESDFIAMTGMKPPRRPKKRPKVVQRQLDTLVPGAWLTEITPETYKVPDLPEAGKG